MSDMQINLFSNSFRVNHQKVLWKCQSQMNKLGTREEGAHGPVLRGRNSGIAVSINSVKNEAENLYLV